MRILRPEAVIGGNVKKEVTTCHRAGERSRIPEIAADALHVQFANFTRRAAQCANPMAALHQRAGDMPAEETTRAGD